MKANERKKEMEFFNWLFLSCLIEFCTKLCSNLFCLLILIGRGFSSPPFNTLVKLDDYSLKLISIIMRVILMSYLYFPGKDVGQTSQLQPRLGGYTFLLGREYTVRFQEG